MILPRTASSGHGPNAQWAASRPEVVAAECPFDLLKSGDWSGRQANSLRVNVATHSAGVVIPHLFPKAGDFTRSTFQSKKS
jgi:hypothetical protein